MYHSPLQTLRSSWCTLRKQTVLMTIVAKFFGTSLVYSIIIQCVVTSNINGEPSKAPYTLYGYRGTFLEPYT